MNALAENFRGFSLHGSTVVHSACGGNVYTLGYGELHDDIEAASYHALQHATDGCQDLTGDPCSSDKRDYAALADNLLHMIRYHWPALVLLRERIETSCPSPQPRMATEPRRNSLRRST